MFLIKRSVSMIGLRTVIGLLGTFPAIAYAGNNPPPRQNFWGGYTTYASTDINKPVPDRSYFVTTVTPEPGGAKLVVEMFHGQKDAPVSLTIQVAINDGSGNLEVIPIKKLQDKVADNPNNYYSRREFVITHAELNTLLAQLLPAGANHIVIGSGTPLFLLAEWSGNYTHQWGSVARGGIFFMPEDPNASVVNANSSANTRRPTELDLGYVITRNMIFKYPGLKEYGQIRSRLESEGKYQIPLEEMLRIKQRLLDLSQKPGEVTRILGADWSLELQTRYLKKDKNNKLILDKDGNPIPDPMVDTYYDNSKLEAAKNDMALRYRWTEGNATGSWNFKPGLTSVSTDGIADRIEFGVDTIDDKPETIKKFADSVDPLNPFKLIRKIAPGSTPSEFFNPAVKITDTRFKYKLRNKTGLVIEVSLDDVTAESLIGEKRSIRYGQVEMDIDHLAVASQNVAQGPTNIGTSNNSISVVLKRFLGKLGNGAFLDGRPVMHTVDDLDPRSAVKTTHASDFSGAGKAVVAIREDLLGADWIPGAQKYAFAAAGLGILKESEVSPSVKAVINAFKKSAQSGKTKQTLVEHTLGLANCGAAFN
ncbi:MAG: hypothetical protein AABZ06_13730 [Bdellovibrionota bacterium]